MWDMDDLKSFTLDQLIELAAYHGIVQSVHPDGHGYVLHLTDGRGTLTLSPKAARFYLIGCLCAVPIADRTRWPGGPY